MDKTKFLAKFFAIGALTLALLSFNWDRVELEGRAFVVTIGVDTAEDEAFEVSMSIADVAAMEGDAAGADAATLRVAQGESLARAMGQIDAKMSDAVYYGHTKAIVLGEEILADAGLLKEVVDTLSRKNDINTKCIIMATDKSAKDVLAAKPQEQSLLGVYLSGFYNSHDANAAAAVVKMDLEGLVNSLLHGGSAVLPKVTLEEEEKEEEAEEAKEAEEAEDAGIAISGVAVLGDFALAGYVPNEYMAGFLWLMADAAGAQVVIDAGEDGHITLLVQKSTPRIGLEAADGQLHCLVRLRAEGNIEGARFLQEHLFDKAVIEQLQSDFEAKIRGEIEEIFAIFQQELGVDGFGLKEICRKRYPRLYEVYGGDWQAAFKEMALVVDVDLAIRNAGPVK